MSGIEAELPFDNLFFQVSSSHNYQVEGVDGKNLSRTSGMDYDCEMEDNEVIILMFDASTILVFDNNGNPLELVSKNLTFSTFTCMKV